MTSMQVDAAVLICARPLRSPAVKNVPHTGRIYANRMQINYANHVSLDAAKRYCTWQAGSNGASQSWELAYAAEMRGIGTRVFRAGKPLQTAPGFCPNFNFVYTS